MKELLLSVLLPTIVLTAAAGLALHRYRHRLGRGPSMLGWLLLNVVMIAVLWWASDVMDTERVAAGRPRNWQGALEFLGSALGSAVATIGILLSIILVGRRR